MALIRSAKIRSLQGQLAPEARPGEVEVSLGVIKGRLPLDRSTRERLGRFFRRKPIEELVEVSGGEAFISIREPDRGTLDLYVRVANFSKRDVRIEQVVVDWLGLSQEGLPLLPLVPLGGMLTVCARSTKIIPLQMQLTAAAIRDVVSAILPAPNLRSTPSAHVHLRAGMIVAHRRDRTQLNFELNIPSPSLRIANDLAAVQRGT